MRLFAVEMSFLNDMILCFLIAYLVNMLLKQSIDYLTYLSTKTIFFWPYGKFFSLYSLNLLSFSSQPRKVEIPHSPFWCVFTVFFFCYYFGGATMMVGTFIITSSLASLVIKWLASLAWLQSSITCRPLCDINIEYSRDIIKIYQEQSHLQYISPVKDFRSGNMPSTWLKALLNGWTLVLRCCVSEW